MAALKVRRFRRRPRLIIVDVVLVYQGKGVIDIFVDCVCAGNFLLVSLFFIQWFMLRSLVPSFSSPLSFLWSSSLLNRALPLLRLDAIGLN